MKKIRTVTTLVVKSIIEIIGYFSSISPDVKILIEILAPVVIECFSKLCSNKRCIINEPLLQNYIVV